MGPRGLTKVVLSRNHLRDPRCESGEALTQEGKPPLSLRRAGSHAPQSSPEIPCMQFDEGLGVWEETLQPRWIDEGPEISANNFRTDQRAQDLGSRSGFRWVYLSLGLRVSGFESRLDIRRTPCPGADTSITDSVRGSQISALSIIADTIVRFWSVFSNFRIRTCKKDDSVSS